MLVKIAKVQLSFAELIVDIWQLPTEAHQGGKGVCRPSIPHPPQQLIPSPLSIPTSHHKLHSSFFLIFFFYLPPRNCLQGLAATPIHTQSQLLALCTRHPRCGALPPLPWFNLLYVLPCGINNMSLASDACCFILLPAVGAPLFVWLCTNKHDFSLSMLSLEFPRYF